MPVVIMNNVQFYQPSNLLNSLKPQNLRLATIPTPFNPSAQRLFPTADISSSLFHSSQQLGHSLSSYIAVESVSEFGLHTCQAGESRDDPIVVDDLMVISHDDEQRDQGGELNGMADSRVLLAL
ncbi:conserved hypothetical protein [Histoplasma capsulatum H143]|uniref:Uncharacterized protein n=1 Tax=Ajellomyces capsulatus (strain H143) TaxID=544712 RepID=C6H8W0_AJECH|nr:conserved hypothetical protein [Histoplasma capsulatum H143]